MSSNEQINDAVKTEWYCRILLTISLVRIISGYIVFMQADYQLISPLISKSLVYEITNPYMTACLYSSIIFLAALWFYFFKKRYFTITLSVLCLVAYEIIFFILARK